MQEKNILGSFLTFVVMTGILNFDIVHPILSNKERKLGVRKLCFRWRRSRLMNALR